MTICNPFMKICGDLIVADNNSDGVGEAIEKYIIWLDKLLKYIKY